MIAYMHKNYVYDRDGKTVTQVSGDDTYFETGNYIPIPLTEEWLVKFGFTKYGADDSTFEIYDMVVSFTERKIWVSQSAYEAEVKLVRYVHQLQNLYFLLVGKELSIKS